MKSVAIMSRVTVDLIYSGWPRLPDPGEEVLCSGFALMPGGGAVVSAVVLPRLGVPVKAGLFMGGGMEGAMASMLLKRHGLGEYVSLPSEGQPVVFSSVLSYGGERGILSYDEGHPPLRDSEILDFCQDCDITLLPDCPAPVQELKAGGRLVVCDPNMPSLPRIAGMLRHIHILTPNRAEAAALSGREDLGEALRWLVESGVEMPVIKLGGDGCLAWIDGGARHVPAAGGFPVADTTGAGDNFVAGLLYGLARGLPPERCLRIANLLGAASCAGPGAFAQQLTAGDIRVLECK